MLEQIFGDKYEVLTELGKYRNAWLVLQPQTKQIYVGKSMDMYNLEVYEMLAAIHNIHIPQIIDYMEVGAKLYVIEEYVNGKTLEDIRLEGKIKDEQVISWMIQLCEALEYLHSCPRPIIHRDVKPSNIMITNDGVLKLIDYNAARHYENGMNQDTRLIGTTGYAAPEQYGFAQTDARTDIYAMGVVLNYLLTGKHINTQVCNGKWGNIVKKCTYMDPTKRYQNVGEVKRLIKSMKEVDEKEQGKKEKQINPWIIPGFRSGNPLKAIVAIVGYLFIIALAAQIEIESNKGKPLIATLDRICVGLAMLFVVVLVTDYGEISRYIPFIGDKSIWKRMTGYVIFGFLGLVIAAIVPELVKAILGL